MLNKIYFCILIQYFDSRFYSSFTANTQTNCTIHEVYIEPCKEIAEGKPCKIKRGVIGNMTFHYTPGKYYIIYYNIEGKIKFIKMIHS